MQISKYFVKSSFDILNKALVITIWAVEEIGKNSVKPSIIAIRIACNVVIIKFVEVIKE